MCYRVSKQSSFGIPYKVKCLREDYKDGLCLKHWKASQSKLIPWGQRKTYRPMEAFDLRTHSHLKLKTENINNIYRLYNNIIQLQTKDNQWINTNIPPDINLFCVKI